ncbi:hypothetical protein EZS27_015714 [termite gut metagenome]|uniref:3-keto-alpha-glucoside-1,2-lyase/3-keto-2-hydroxy-glucal hydratase domain-containing protein n=1 Tax=termite gut metagenome TaxID=433724 RepID=A0A5J4RQX2_9ZZZZ
MKRDIRFYTLLLVCFCFVGCQQKQLPEVLKSHKDLTSFTKLANTVEVISLFNGNDLTNWYTYIDSLGVNAPESESFFTVEDSTLHFNGPYMGYLCTNDSYKNYYLKVVFHWGEKKYPPRENSKRDSGILYHFPTDAVDNLWPNSIECQVQEEDCGDYYFVNGAHALPTQDAAVEGAPTHITRTANYENPGQEWNVIEIICVDDKSEHYVNGHLVNEAYSLSNTEGKILLQLEGAEVYYKTVELISLK